MKEKLSFKEFSASLIMFFTLAFMLFIYEPIVAYSSNVNDYWFNFKTLVLNNLLIFIGVLLSFSLLSFIIYFVSKKLKKDIIYKIYLMIVFIVFIATYIQGNYLAGSLPTLDGSPITWSDYTKQSLISIGMWLVLIVINIILYKKLSKEYTSIVKYASLAVFAMLSVSLVSILLTNKEIYVEKGSYTATTDNINQISKNQNFLMLVVDMADSKTFNNVLKNMGKEELLKDFTYYPDTLSAYPFTRESIPFMLSGEWFVEQDTFTNYYNDVMNNSKFLKTLRDKNYDINIYESELGWTDEKALDVNNIKAVNFEIDKNNLFKQEFKYLSFKYLPFNLKKYSQIESLDYTLCRKSDLDTNNIYKMENDFVYDELNSLKTQKNNYFQFLHIDGGHYPWDMNKDFEKIENGTYEEKIESSIVVIEKYLDRIKESGQYDNSVIIILADHGNNGYDPVGRQNPILYIKGINEKNIKMKVSDKKVSYDDLNQSIYYDLLDGKKSDDLLTNIDKNRKRRFIWYKDYDKLYEQVLDGHAWETDKLKNTGKKYER